MSSPTPPSPTPPAAPTIEVDEPGWQRWALRLLPALTFVVGLGLGAVVVLASQPERDAPEAGGEPSASPSAAAGEGTADTVVTLPGACEDAAETLTEATRLIDDVAAAVRDFRPDELVGLLDRLEDLDSEVRSQTAECSRVDVSESASPEPSPSS
jgi:hypothetical protein